MTPREMRRDRLFDLVMVWGAWSKANGFRVNDVMNSESWSHNHVRAAIHDLRLWMADTGDKINLVCEPDGAYNQWLYYFTGDPAEAAIWIDNRDRDLVSRLETIKAVSATLVNATDGRTAQGKRVRKVERTVSYLLTELQEIV